MLLTEQTQSVLELLEEKGASGGIRVRGEFGRVDVPTANGRRYPRKIFESAVGKVKSDIKDRKVLGECDHPSDGKGSLFRVSHLITDLQITEDGIVIGEAEIIPGTPGGNIMEALIRAKVNVGVSSRGTGTVKKVEEGVDEVQDDFVLSTYDFVLDPAMRTAYPKVVSEAIEVAESPATPEAVQNYLKALPEEYQKLILTEALKGISTEAPELQAVVQPLQEQIKAVESQKSISEEAVTKLTTELTEARQALEEAKKAQKAPSAHGPSADAYPHPAYPGEGKWDEVPGWGPKITSGEHAGEYDVRWWWEPADGSDARLYSAVLKKWLHEEVHEKLQVAETEVATLKSSMEEKVQEQVTAKVAEATTTLQPQVRESIQKEMEADPRIGLAKKLLEEITTKFAPLIAGENSAFVRELQEKVKAYRDAGLKAEYENARLAEALEASEKALKEARMSLKVWEEVASHPKAAVLHDLVGIPESDQGMKTKLNRLLEMKEFGDSKEAQEAVIQEAVKKAVEIVQNNWIKRVEELEEAQQKEVSELQKQLQEATTQKGAQTSARSLLEQETIQLKGNLEKAVKLGTELATKLDEEKSISKRLQEEQNGLDDEVGVLEAKVKALKGILTRTDRIAVAQRIEECRTAKEVQLALKQTAQPLEEDTAPPVPSVRRRSQVIEGREGELPNSAPNKQDVQEIGVSPAEFARLMG